MMRTKSRPESGELISPAFLESLFGAPVSVPPAERPRKGKEPELISDEMLRLLFPKSS